MVGLIFWNKKKLFIIDYPFKGYLAGILSVITYLSKLTFNYDKITVLITKLSVLTIKLSKLLQ